MSDRAPFLPTAVIALLTTAVLYSAPAQASGVAWQDLTVDEALALAAEENKLIFLDVYATWCGPCHQLDAEVFPTTQAEQATADLIALRIDAEAGEGPALVERFHVVGFPTMLVIRPDGAELDRIFGFLPADEFATTLNGYREGRGTIDELRARHQADPSDLELTLELGQRAAVRGEYAEAATLLARVIAEDADNAAGLRVQAHHTLGKYMYLRGQSDYAAALEQFEILINEFAGTPEAEDAVFQRIVAHVRAEEGDAAWTEITALMDGNQQDVSLINSIAWLCYRERFRMEDAVEIARRGLAQDDQADYLWDTLAELQFALGDAAGAVESVRRAVGISPDEQYYQGQLQRFSGSPATN